MAETEEVVMAAHRAAAVLAQAAVGADAAAVEEEINLKIQK